MFSLKMKPTPCDNFTLLCGGHKNQQMLLMRSSTGDYFILLWLVKDQEM